MLEEQEYKQSALMVGLDNASPNPGNVEEYNGSAWTEAN
jgi:hypothetical protein